MDLNSQVVNLGGWTLISANAINDSGQITGFGGINGLIHAFLLTPVSPATFDTATQGSWNGKYGTDGYMIANGATLLPSYASVSSTTSTFTWAGATTDVRALQNGRGATNRIASTFIPANYGNSLSWDINITDGKTHQAALYFLDWDSTSRAETVILTDAVTGAVVDGETISNFHGGTYGVWNLKGHTTIKVTGGGSPVLSGIFFDTASTGPPPSFVLNASQVSESACTYATVGLPCVRAGQTGSATVFVIPANGFNGAVTLAASGWPAGITGTFVTNPTTGSSSVTVNVAAGVGFGNYNLPVTGSSGSLSASINLALVVPSLTLVASAAAASAGSTGSAFVYIQEYGNAAVTLSTTGWPAGITGTFLTNPVPGLGGGSGLSVNVGSNVTVGQYSLTVTGTSAILTATTTVALTVTASVPNPTFTLSATPVTVTAGSSGNTTVIVTPLNGFNSAVAITPTGWPASFQINYISGNPININFTVPANFAPGNYPLTVTGTANGGLLTVATTMMLTVNSPGASSATFTGLDNATEGAWKGLYGADGYLIANLASGLPSYAAVTPTGASTYTWAQQSTDLRALQIPGGSTGIASSYYSNSFSFNVNLKDGNTHQVALYMLDWDTTGRAESIKITDAVSNALLDQQPVSGFHNGQYRVWNIKGNVNITVTVTAGANAVVSGLFFGPASGVTAPPSFTLSATTATANNGASGTSTVTVNPSNGFNSAVTLTASNWPAGITGTFGTNPTTGSSVVTINVAGNVAAGPYSLTVNGSGGGLTASTAIPLTVTFANQGFTLNLSPTGASIAQGSTGTVTANLIPSGGFNTPVTLSTSGWPAGITGTFGTNPATTSSVLTISVGSGVTAGPYSLIVAGAGGSANASATLALTVTGSSGGSQVSFAGLDTTTQGAWTGVYGSGGYLIANDTINPPAGSARYATINGASTFTWAAASPDPRALQNAPGSATRIASTYTQYPNTGFTINIATVSSFALYLLDWDGGGSRTETITISDAATGVVLDSKTFSGFSNGQYAKWNTTPGMNLVIKVTPAQGTTPAVSGIFFN